MKRILIIDDEILITKTLKKLLVKEGYVVIIVNNGLDALTAIDKEEFDLVITDIRMPGIDGIETVKKIKETLSKKKQKENPIIFITGYANEEAHSQAEAIGCSSYIYKPFDLKMFLQKIKDSIKKGA